MKKTKNSTMANFTSWGLGMGSGCFIAIICHEGPMVKHVKIGFKELTLTYFLEAKIEQRKKKKLFQFQFLN